MSPDPHDQSVHTQGRENRLLNAGFAGPHQGIYARVDMAAHQTSGTEDVVDSLWCFHMWCHMFRLGLTLLQFHKKQNRPYNFICIFSMLQYLKIRNISLLQCLLEGDWLDETRLTDHSVVVCARSVESNAKISRTIQTKQVHVTSQNVMFIHPALHKS